MIEDYTVGLLACYRSVVLETSSAFTIQSSLGDEFILNSPDAIKRSI